MQTEQLVNQLKAVLPRYTGDFTTNLEISSITRVGSVATATTLLDHELEVGDQVLVNGAKVPVVISSLTRNGIYALAITSSDHPLIRGNATVEIAGSDQSDYNGVQTLLTDKNHLLSAPLIEILSITISGTTATVTTKTDHGFVDDSNVEVQVGGASNPNYNKNTGLDSVPAARIFTYTVHGATESASPESGQYLKVKQLINSRTFIFKVSGSPTTPATGSITQLSSLKAGYNGYKVVATVPSTTTFTYVCDTLGTPAQGTMSARIYQAITGAIDYDMATNVFQSANTDKQATNWAFIVVGDETSSKNQATRTDGLTTNQSGNDIRENAYQNVTLYIFIPCGATNDQLLYSKTRDVAYSYKPFIFKALLGFKPSSDLTDIRYSSLMPISNGKEDFNGSHYVHQYTFQASCWYNQSDAVDADDAFAFRTFDFDVLDNEGFETSVMEIAGDVDQLD
jgi:hypothetical protein